jgi:osmotically-inducible protein OsmY
MSRYDEPRFRGDRDRGDGRDRRPERESSRDEAPPRSSFYPSGGYGFNPGEYEGSGNAYTGRGSGQRHDERAWPSRSEPDYSPETSYGRSGSSRQGWGFWGRDDAGDSRGSFDRTFGGSAGSAGSSEQRRYRPGPKGYTRSDERLLEDIAEQLMTSYDIDSSEVTITVKDGKVTLDGTVPERWMKHSIEDVADRCAGVRDVDNRVRVSQAAPPSG